MHHLVVHRQPWPQGEGQQQERQNLVPQTTGKTNSNKTETPTILFCSALIKFLFTEYYYITCTQLYLFNCTIECSIKIKWLWETRELSYTERAFLKGKKSLDIKSTLTRFFSLQLERISCGINPHECPTYKYRFQALLGSQFSMCSLRSPFCSTPELPDWPEPRPRGLEQLMEWKIVGTVGYYYQECQWDSWRGQYQNPFLETYSHSSCKGLTVCSAQEYKTERCDLSAKALKWSETQQPGCRLHSFHHSGRLIQQADLSKL